LNVVDHVTPTRVAFDELAADVPNRADPDSEHDEIEIFTYLQRLRLDFAPIPKRLEIPSLAPHLLTVDELLVARRRRPAR